MAPAPNHRAGVRSVAPVSATTDIATRAGELRARHWRRDQRVSLADCFVIASAEPGERIATRRVADWQCRSVDDAASADIAGRPTVFLLLSAA